ncbi:MAG: Gx transporter family protein [Endomicrobia bacterium]|nr:Gx transporter family protein [Endomicrobiia bacterium]MCX7716518.1 Gx transporter family protein [Endomicrobiia bacterium]
MDKKIVKLILFATTLQVVESYFPHPIPGVRLGLANFVTLITVVYFGIYEAIKLSVFRTICASLFLGTFLSVSFIISFVSAVVSSFTMWVVYSLSSKLKFSIVSISVFGAITHNLTQIAVVYLLFIRQKEVFYFTPVLIASAVLTGTITGMVALSVLRKLDINKFLNKEIKLPSNETIEMKSNFTKFVMSMLLLITLFVVSTFWVQIFLFFILLILVFFNRKDGKVLFINIRRVLWISICSFFVPLIFNQYGKVLLNLKIFSLTYEGMRLSLIYTFRILNITILSTLFILWYEKKELALVMDKILFFYNRSGTTVIEVLTSFPVFFETVKRKIAQAKIRKIKEIIPRIVSILVEILED